MRTMAEIIGIIKSLKNVVNDSDVANLLGTKPKTLATAKTRNSIPFEELTTFCNKEGISLNWLLTDEGPMERGKVSEDQLMWRRVADILKKKGKKEEEALKIAEEIVEYVEPETEKILALLKDMDTEKRRDILKIIELLSAVPALSDDELKWLGYYRRAQQLSPERLEYAIRIMEGVFRGLGLMEEEEKLRVEKKAV